MMGPFLGPKKLTTLTNNINNNKLNKKFHSCRGRQNPVYRSISKSIFPNHFNEVHFNHGLPRTVGIYGHPACFVGITVGIVSSIMQIPSSGGHNGTN